MEVGTEIATSDEGPSNWISDDWSTLWSFSKPYRYISATVGGTLQNDGDAEIDAVCAGYQPIAPIIVPAPPPSGGGIISNGGGGSSGSYWSPSPATSTPVSLPPPLIHIVIRPNASVVPYGGAITYTYTVTNPNTFSLNNVNVADDKCSPVTYSSGDTNNNNILEVSETWMYTCNTHLITTTVNTANTNGNANGQVAGAYDEAKVEVISPKFPKTGFPSNPNQIPWSATGSILILSGGILSTLVFFFVRSKKIIKK